MSILLKTLASLNSADVPEVKPLTLRNVGTSSGNVSITKTGTPTVDGLQYRMEGEKSWLPYTIDTKIAVNPNEAVQFQNTNETLSTNTAYAQYTGYAQFVIPDGTEFDAEGNIQSLLNYSDSVSYYCFHLLFKNCGGLVDASQLELPATTLAVHCYSEMFSGCKKLKTAPKLPATTLANGCYGSMFSGCTNLKKIKVYFTKYHDSALTDWVDSVSSTGTFYKPTALPTQFGTNRIPTGWTVINN